jgi:predicted RNA methylase
MVKCDLTTIDQNPRFKDYFDTIVMNPPFGTKNNEGIDMKLLSAAVYVILLCE